MPRQGAPVTVVNTSGAPIQTTNTTASGTPAPDGTSTNPEFHRVVGAASGNSGQNPTSISPAAALLVVPARAGRQSVTVSNVTGTQPVYFVPDNRATGLTTGFFLAGTVGATATISSQAAIYATSPTAAQTISYWENY